MKKSTTQEIRERFDNEVERFANLTTGQVAIVDADLMLELVTEAAKYIVPQATHVLDIGCGAGNYTLKMLSKMPNLHCTMIDLSQPMLQRAHQRVSAATSGRVETIQGDMRDIALQAQRYDIILAGAVLHHLRDDEDWENMFKKLYDATAKGGCLMIADLIAHESPVLERLAKHRWAAYLEKLGGNGYAQKVFDYIDKEDTPRSLAYQLALMKKVGFAITETLHQNTCFAAFCGIK